MTRRQRPILAMVFGIVAVAVTWRLASGATLHILDDYVAPALAWVKNLLVELEFQFLTFLAWVIGLWIVWYITTRVYQKTVKLLLWTAFSEDAPPARQETDELEDTARRVDYLLLGVFLRLRHFVDTLLYYHGLFSRDLIRTLLWLMSCPGYEWQLGAFKFWWPRPCLRPGMVYDRARIYVETRLFSDDESPAHAPAVESDASAVLGGSLMSSSSQLAIPKPRPALQRRQRHATYCSLVRRREALPGTNGDASIAEMSSTPADRIHCETCFDLYDRIDSIKKYLLAVLELGGQAGDVAFLCPIRVQSGFLAPTYLVSGILKEFDEDWKRIVSGYKTEIQKLDQHDDPLHPLRDLRMLQSFIWNCWIQWGPSVPICSSPAWVAGQERSVALQYGYGDENNSFPIRYRSSTFEMWRQELKVISGSLRAGLPSAGGVAWPVTLEGHLRWMTGKERRLSMAAPQQGRQPEHAATEVKPGHSDQGWLVMDCSDLQSDPGAPMFYSAYIWVMVAICRSESPDQEGPETAPGSGFELLHPLDNESEAWRGLIPFFQHGNIAEAAVYEDIKVELAGKTVDSLLRQLHAADQSGCNWLQFAFVCSFDENGDDFRDSPATMTAVVSPTHAATTAPDCPCEASPGSHPIVDLPGNSIRASMVQALAERQLRDPTLVPLAARIHLSSTAVPELTACHIPRIVDHYLEHVRQVTDVKT